MSSKNTENKVVISPNLLPAEAKEELYYQTVGETVTRIVLVLSVMVIFFWILAGIFLWKIYQEKNSIALNLANNADSSKIQELGRINEQFKELRTLNAKVEKSLQKEYRFSEALAELPKIVPGRVALVSYETIMSRPGWVKIKGIAQSREDFIRFKQNLESSNSYEKVESPLSNYVTPESVDFEIQASLKNWKPSWAEDLKKKPANLVENENSNE